MSTVVHPYAWMCPKCKKYSIIRLQDDLIESETLRSGNFYIIFFPQYGSASIVSTGEDGEKILKSFKINDLTHEEAIHWNNKLRTYVLFQ